MRSWMLISLVLISVLIHEAQGIRLGNKGTLPDRHYNILKILQGRKSNDGLEEVIMCKGRHCLGRIRRLITTPIIYRTTIIAKNDKNPSNAEMARKDENLSVNSSYFNNEQRQPIQETYPDTLDIAGMDYSQARRKPPIHN